MCINTEGKELHVTCANDSPGAQYMLETASLSQDSATSTQLQKYVSWTWPKEKGKVSGVARVASTVRCSLLPGFLLGSFLLPDMPL